LYGPGSHLFVQKKKMGGKLNNKTYSFLHRERGAFPRIGVSYLFNGRRKREKEGGGGEKKLKSDCGWGQEKGGPRGGNAR